MVGDVKSLTLTWRPLQWRHNGHNGVLNHQPHDCLLKRLFRRRSKKTYKLRVTGLCVGNSPMTGKFPTQMASNTENVSIWWRHHDSNIMNLSPGSGTLEWEEFLPLMAAKLKEKEEQAFYKNLFRILDKKNKGHIRCEDLRFILVGMAEEVGLTEDEIDDMIHHVDEDGNGEVSFEGG